MTQQHACCAVDCNPRCRAAGGGRQGHMRAGHRSQRCRLQPGWCTSLHATATPHGGASTQAGRLAQPSASGAAAPESGNETRDMKMKGNVRRGDALWQCRSLEHACEEGPARALGATMHATPARSAHAPLGTQSHPLLTTLTPPVPTALDFGTLHAHTPARRTPRLMVPRPPLSLARVHFPHPA